MPAVIDGSGASTFPAATVSGTLEGATLTEGGVAVPRMVLSTAQNTTSGTSIDFTGIPSWVKRITVSFSFVSTNGTSNMRLRIGPVGGVETSGYSGSSTAFAATALTVSNFTAGVDISDGGVGTASRNGQVVFTLIDSATNNWAFSGNIGQGDTTRGAIVSGSKPLAGALSILRLTTVSGTDTFDAGSCSIIYEG